MIVEAGGVDLHGGGVHHAALTLARRLLRDGDLGLFGLGRLRGGVLLFLGCLGRGFLPGLLFSLLLRRLGSESCRPDHLERADLVLLRQRVKDNVQLLVGEHLHVAARFFKVLLDNRGDFLGLHTEIRGDLFDFVLD